MLKQCIGHTKKKKGKKTWHNMITLKPTHFNIIIIPRLYNYIGSWSLIEIRPKKKMVCFCSPDRP